MGFVRQFCDAAFSHVGLDYTDHVSTDPMFYRPAEIHLLLGDCTKAEKKLGWNYNLGLKEMVTEMVESDLNFYSK